MTLFLARAAKRSTSGKRYGYYVLKTNFWDSRIKAQRQKYVAYIGPSAAISPERAKLLANRVGLSMSELQQKVRGLKIKEQPKKGKVRK